MTTTKKESPPSDYERDFSPIPRPPAQDRKALLFVGLGLLFVACVIFGVLMFIASEVGPLL